MTLNGYIVPEHYNNETTTQKYLTPKKIVIRESVDTTIIDDTEMVLSDKCSSRGGGVSKDIFSIGITNGIVFEQGTGVTVSAQRTKRWFITTNTNIFYWSRCWNF